MATLAERWERLRNVPGARRDLSALVALIVVALLCTGFIFGQYGTKMPWQQDQTVVAEFEKVPSVRPQSRQEVRIAGVTVGRIESAKPMANGHAKVTMSLKKGVKIYKDASAVLESKAPINVMYISLSPGHPEAGRMAGNDVIPVGHTKRVIQPWELLDKLDERTQSALTSLIDEADVALASAPKSLAPGLRSTTDTMNTFIPVVTELRKRRELIKGLVTDLSAISTAAGDDDERLARLVTSLQTTMVTLDDRSTQLEQSLGQLPGFTQELDASMQETTALTGQLNPVLKSVRASADDLPPALKRLRSTVDTLGGLVDSAAPVVRLAGPVVADLRPLVSNARPAFGNLTKVTTHLPTATAKIVPWMDDLAAFVYQTSSAFSLSDVNGGLGRADLEIDVRNPTGGLGGDPSLDGETSQKSGR